MKVLFSLLISLTILSYSAQNLVATSVNSQWPDTVAVNSTVNFGLVVSNIDSLTSFNDSLSIVFQADTGVSATVVDTFNLGVASIDSSGFDFFSISHTFNSTRYAPGNNVVVIWPISNGVLGDSLILETYVDYSVDVAENKIETIHIYPNPVHDAFVVSGEKQFYYCIKDVSGRQITNDYSESGNIYTDKLPNGIYFLSLNNNGIRTKCVKFIKH